MAYYDCIWQPSPLDLDQSDKSVECVGSSVGVSHVV